MNKDALFCDGTSDYRFPPEPEEYEKVRLKFRTAKDDTDEVYLFAENGKYQMKKSYTRGVFDYYEIEWQLSSEPFSYCFEIRKAAEVCYYNRCGAAGEIIKLYDFTIVPGFSTPDWAKGAVIYQIFVDRFYNGDTANDVEDREYIYIGQPSEKVKDWSSPPAVQDIHRFYGGDLQGVMDKLDYLEELGVEVIYFNPLFVSPSNHKYDIQDYDYIDPHFGRIVADGGDTLFESDTDNITATKYQKRTGDRINLEASNALFIKLVEAMHSRGMRVILDGVFNHCGSFNKWLDRERIYEQQESYEKGAYVSADSPFRSFFHFYNENDSAWPYNSAYEGWWGHDTLPKLNYEDSKMLVSYIIYIAKKWVSPPFNVDGWRLDVAADLGYSNEYNHLFWKHFRKEVKEANPDALILAEHYGDPTEWLHGDEWDSIMNYDAFMEPVTWFLTGMEKHSDERRMDLWGNADNFVNIMSHFMSNMLTPSLQTAMNELSNHDHSRFLTRTNHIVGRVQQLGYKAAEEGVNKAVMRIAVVMQMTWVGAPAVYYGDEVSLCGFTDPDNRRTYPWGNEDKEMMEFHKKLISIHKNEKPIKTGSLRMLFWERNILAYSRFKDDEQIVVILNNSKDLREITVPVWQAEVPVIGRMERLVYSYEDGYTIEPDEYLVIDGEIVLNIGRHSAVVMRTMNNKTGHKEDIFLKQ
ncbi:glycoside hydrolase family 13 protein [Muricomes intestini]|uniref:glycoside hydrolase family 13 protein n=1 Tax=Muricomes intestini TaxID=1796634 RepID=UPI002FDABBD8